MRQKLTLDLKRTALLLIDLQEEQRSDPEFTADDFASVLRNACRLLAAARLSKVPVFHAAYKRDFSVVPPRPFEQFGSGGTARFSDHNSPQTKLCHEVAPLPGEFVLNKNDASAFEEGSLAGQLRAAGTEWLVVSGVWTEQCVAASVRDAMAQGLRVLLVKDACGSGTALMHETAVLNLANRLYGGGVADTLRAEALLGGAPAQVWRNERPVPLRFTAESVSRLYATL